MSTLDETDLRILRLLSEDARRPYSEIGERVDLSPPAVSDRVSKLQDYGIIRRFTLDIDRSQLREGTPVLATLSVAPGALEGTRDALSEVDGIENVFTTAGGRVVLTAHAPTTDVGAWLFEHVDSAAVRDLDVELLTGSDRTTRIGGEAAFSVSCVLCENEVGADGVSRRIDGNIKRFCCPSCERLYVEKYEELAEGAG
ncbi:MAG: AsnC family transcriptional regulator [Halalkalicoccus sp.]